MMDACYTINRKAGYIRVMTMVSDEYYPLDMAAELKTQQDWTWQEFANEMGKFVAKELEDMK